MNKYTAIGLIALLMLVAAWPFYAYLEPHRMDQAQEVLREKFAAQGANTYVQNCASCHGPNGEGIGGMPALNRPGLTTADPQILYDTIAHSPHGTAMSAWHTDEGGALNSYQVEGLVTLIVSANWAPVSELASAKKLTVPTPVAPEVQLATMEATGDDPHECRACHEEPAIHADRFGLNCSRCHTLQAWKPALLTRHVFFLDHGGDGNQACQKCHTETYSEHTCYGCHDHEPDQMQVAHALEEITDFEQCVKCHPTGIEREAASLGYGRSAQAANGEASGEGTAGQAGAGRPRDTGDGGPRGTQGPVGNSGDNPSSQEDSLSGARGPAGDSSDSPPSQEDRPKGNQGPTGNGGDSPPSQEDLSKDAQGPAGNGGDSPPSQEGPVSDDSPGAGAMKAQTGHYDTDQSEAGKSDDESKASQGTNQEKSAGQ